LVAFPKVYNDQRNNEDKMLSSLEMQPTLGLFLKTVSHMEILTVLFLGCYSNGQDLRNSP